MAGAAESFQGIIGRSPAMQALFADIERFAPVDVPVLIRDDVLTVSLLLDSAAELV